MFRSFRALTHPFLIPVLVTMACSGGQPGGENGTDEPESAGSAGEESGDAGQRAQGEGGRPETTKPSRGGGAGKGGSSGSGGGGSMSDAGSDAGGADAGGAAGEAGETVCVSTGSDAPDDDFADSNCDGIDGDFTRAVFVSPDGSDGANGALATPLRRIDDAIELAASTERDVYVCNGTFIEPVTITKPIAVYGGYDCDNGARRTKDRAVVAPQRGLALMIQNVPGKVHVERLAFRAVDGVAPGESSQAGSIVASNDVALSHVEFKAGQGADGKPGAPGANASQVAPFSGAPGGDAPATACNAEAMTGTCQTSTPGGFDQRLTHTCQQGDLTLTQRGGAGGSGANVWTALGQPRQFEARSTSVAGTPGAAGGYFSGTTFLSHDANATSRPGWVGATGTDAVLGFGSVLSGIYSASNWGVNGGDGAPGYPGKGGSGGSSWTAASDLAGGTLFYVGGGGGQGGVGGCGGKGAQGGGAGGGSIALVVENSHVSIELSQFETAEGGAGQDGHPGGRGQPGGSPGTPGTAVAGATPTPGTAGGDGGRGGDSGAGAGGPSIGIVHIGTAPQVSECTFNIDTGGPGGISVRSPNIVSGISTDLYAVTPAAPL